MPRTGGNSRMPGLTQAATASASTKPLTSSRHSAIHSARAKFVEPIESEEPAYDHIKDLFRDFSHLLENLRTQMYGEYEPAKRSMIEYLDDFDNEPPKLRLVLRAHAAPS